MNGEFTIAVHALVFLNHKQETVSSDVLADNICTHPVRVRKILAQLGRAGLIEAKEGRRGGGYLFTGNAEDVTLRHIAEALESTFIASAWRSGDVDKECLVTSGMASIMDDLYADLNAVCRERLAQTTIADLDARIFGNP